MAINDAANDERFIHIPPLYYPTLSDRIKFNLLPTLDWQYIFWDDDSTSPYPDENGYYPPFSGTPKTWLEHLDVGMLSSDPKLPHLLVHSCSWTSNTLSDLAKLFCWEILAKANAVDFGPQAARFAQEVYNTLATNHSDSERLSNSFAFHLQHHAFKYFKGMWCSQEYENAISQRKILRNKRWNVALVFSCFIADLFSSGLIESSTMHHCLGLLLREMVSVQHVRVIKPWLNAPDRLCGRRPMVINAAMSSPSVSCSALDHFQMMQA